MAARDLGEPVPQYGVLYRPAPARAGDYGAAACEKRLANHTPWQNGYSCGVVVEIPVIASLQAALDREPSHQLTFMVTEYGKPFTKNGLGIKMREWCDDAGLPQCSTHRPRKAGATIAAENGATDNELMAIFGWTTKKQTALYIKMASRKKLAASGIMKLTLEQTNIEIFPTPEGIDKSETSTVKKRAKSMLVTLPR